MQLVVNDQTDTHTIEQPDYYEDSSSSLSLKDAQDIFKNGRNVIGANSEAFVPNKTYQYWIKFQIRSQSDKFRQWVLEYPLWSFVDAYVIDENGNTQLKKTGQLREQSERDFAVADRNYILLDFYPGESKTCFVKLDAQANNAWFPKDLSFKLSSKEWIDQKNARFQAQVYALCMAFIVIFLYNFFIFLSTGDPAYRYYLVLVFLGFLTTLINSGYFLNFFSFLKPTVSWMFYINRFNTNFFTIIVVLFTIEYLNLKTRYPNTWYKWFRFCLVLLTISLIAVVYDYDKGMYPAIPTFLIATISTVIIGIISIRDKYPGAIYYFIGYSSIWVMGFINVAATIFGLIEENDFTIMLGVPFGQTFEMLIFSFALANRINVLRRENELKNEKIIEQLKENEELQTKVNRELESKVAERTREIQEQSQKLAEEKDRSEQLLLNILPKVTAEELKTKGRATPRYYDQVTILFTDFYGFTRISESLSTDYLVQELDYCFQAFDEIITRYNLEKIKTIGDAYMCAGGIPVTNDTHALDAVRAAIEIREFIEQWNQEKHKNGQEMWELRIGLHTGAVTAGVVGKKKFAYDIWGDAVNLASRMEENCEVGKINISYTTYELVKEEYLCHYRGKIEVKNKGLVSMYYVETEAALEEKT